MKKSNFEYRPDMNIQAFSAFAVILLSAAFAAGCDRKDDAKVATQVAARVNADEITVHQVNHVLAQRQDIQPEFAAQAKRAALDRLINQQLARQKAIEAQLDRSPEVVQAIEAAKTEILARAHVDGINRTLLKPTPLEIQKYYSKHPELFAQRRVFSLEEIAFAAGDDVAATLRKNFSRPQSMKEIAEWLQSKGVRFSANRGVRAAEQIPLAILPGIHAMTKGEIRLFEAVPGRYQVIRVVDFLEAPMDEATAAPQIERFLFNQVSGAAVAREMGQIRKQSKIEYLGEFAERAAAPETMKGEPGVKSFTEAEAKAEADAQARPQDRAGKPGQK
jgi:EpsD family peptidyl-prolyl cis-trans isomerase